MGKIATVSVKDLKEKTTWVYRQIQKHGLVVLTHRGKPVAIVHRFYEKDLRLTRRAHKMLGL